MSYGIDYRNGKDSHVNDFVMKAVVFGLKYIDNVTPYPVTLGLITLNNVVFFQLM